MIRRAALFLTLLLAPTLGLAHSQASFAQTAEPSLVIVAGDSVAAGIGSSLPRRRGVGPLVTEWMNSSDQGNRTLANLARAGESAQTFLDGGQLEELREEVELADSAGIEVGLVILSLGGNDLLTLGDAGLSDRETRLQDTRSALDEALGEIRTALGSETDIVLINYYDPSGENPEVQYSDAWWISRFNEMLADVADEHEAFIADAREAFGDAASELTRYPSDVHPTNQGYRAIAREVLQTLNFELTAPDVNVLCPEVVRRLTPTVRFRVDGAVDIQRVSVSSEPGTSSPVVPRGDGEFVSLLDLTGTVSEEVTIKVVIEDVTGAVITVEHQVTRD